MWLKSLLPLLVTVLWCGEKGSPAPLSIYAFQSGYNLRRKGCLQRTLMMEQGNGRREVFFNLLGEMQRTVRVCPYNPVIQSLSRPYPMVERKLSCCHPWEQTGLTNMKPFQNLSIVLLLLPARWMKHQNLDIQPSVPSVTHSKGSSHIDEMESSMGHKWGLSVSEK